MQEPTYMEGCNDKGYLISKKCSKQISLGLKKNMHTWLLLNLALKQKKSRCLQPKYENGLNDFHIAHFTTMICSIKNHFHISALDTYIPTRVKKLGEICPIIQQVSSIIFFQSDFILFSIFIFFGGMHQQAWPLIFNFEGDR